VTVITTLIERWFTVIQHDTEYPLIRNNLNKTLTIEIFVPDADYRKWYKVKRLGNMK
jgi:hypothetical protein